MRPDSEERTPGPGDGSGDSTRRVDRRTVLGGLAGLTVVGSAGCLGGPTAAGQRSFPDNPVSRTVAERPRAGRSRTETGVTLVTFDDPSCPYCAKFHESARRRIESEWVEPGRATVYNRAYYFVEEWGRVAANGLYEVHERNPAAYWELKSRYYANRDELTTSNVVERTRSLVADIDVDAEAVAAAMDERRHAPAIGADQAAGADAGATGVPTTFVFVDGAFVTTLGNDPFDAFRAAVRSRA